MSSKQRILFVDDEVKFTDTMVDLLEEQGFAVKSANSANNATEMLKKEAFDLLITDLNMPGMDGIELIRNVKMLYPQIQIIVATGFPSHESQEEAYKLGVVNYIVKPFTSKRLIELIRKALSGHKNGLIGPMELTCEDLIQTYALQQKTLVLEITNGNGKGKIYFKNGQVIHAETPDSKGDKAFYDILSWKSGTFKTEDLKKDIKPTIEQSVEGLLLEAARRMDEMQKDNVENNVKNIAGEGEVSEINKELPKNERRQSMPSMVEEINAALKELTDNTPGLSLALLVDNEGLPVARRTALQIPEGTTEKVAVASLALLGLSKRTADQLDLQGFQEVLVKADTGYVYALSVGGPSGYALIARTDQNVTLGALFMTVRAARDRINRAMGVNQQA